MSTTENTMTEREQQTEMSGENDSDELVEKRVPVESKKRAADFAHQLAKDAGW